MAKSARPAKNEELSKALDGFGVLNLRSYYANGKGVETPVDFIALQGNFYARTGSESYKIGRIRKNNKVQVFPSDMRGRPKGPEAEAKVRILDESKDAKLIANIEAAFDKRYGIIGRIYSFFEQLRGGENRSIIEIEGL